MARRKYDYVVGRIQGGSFRVLSRDGITSEAISAIGITGLIPAMCPIDKDGNAIRNAMLHTDVRAEKELQEINNIMGNTISHGHMLPKIMWVKENEPDNFTKIEKVMVPHGYIAYKLTDKVTMDYDAASMVGGLLDESTLSW